MKKAKKLLVLLLSAVMCASLGFGMIGVSADGYVQPKYYDWDGKEIVWTFDANGVSSQNIFLSGGNLKYFDRGGYSETLDWYRNRYINSASPFFAFPDAEYQYEAQPDGSVVEFKTIQSGEIYNVDPRYDARYIRLDTERGIDLTKPINLEFSVDPGAWYDANMNDPYGQDRTFFFSLFDDLGALVDPTTGHPHVLWDASGNTHAKVVMGFGTANPHHANPAVKNKFYSTKNGEFFYEADGVTSKRDRTYNFLREEHILTLYIGTELHSVNPNGDYSYFAIDGEEIGKLNVTRESFQKDANGKPVAYVSLGCQGRTSQMKLRFFQSPNARNTVTYASDVDSFNKDSITLCPGALLEVPSAIDIPGYSFDGWYIDEACTVSYDVAEKLFDNISLYAKYLDDAKMYSRATFIAETGNYAPVVLNFETGANFPVIGDVFKSERFTPTFYLEGSDNPITTETVIPSGNIAITAKFTEDPLQLYYRLNDDAPVINKPYEYDKDRNGWDTVHTRYKDDANGEFNNTYYVTEDNQIVISRHYGAVALFDPEDHSEITIAAVGAIANHYKLDLTKEIKFKYSVRNYDIEQNRSPASGKVTFRLIDNWYNALTAGHDNNSKAVVAIETNTVTGNATYGLFKSMHDNVTSRSYGWSGTQQYSFTFFIGENAGESYLKINGEKLVGALANVTRSDFEGGYAYFQIGVRGSSHEFNCLLSQEAQFTQMPAENGSYTCDVPSGLVEFASPINLSFTPNFGYGLSKVTLGGVDYTADVEADNTLTIYKGWGDEELHVEFEAAYEVSFNSRGGSTVDSQYVLGGQFAKQPSMPTRDGCKFRGWFTTADLSGAQFSFKKEAITSDLVLYAKWLSDETSINYTVTFNTDGGTSVSTQTHPAGDCAIRPVADPTKASTIAYNYTFAGWYLNDVEYDFSLPLTDNIVVTAKWTATSVPYTVTYDSKGGTAVASETVGFGQMFTRPTDPTNGNLIFICWLLDGEEYDFDTEVTEHITLVAKWAEEAFVVTFDSKGGSAVSEKNVVSGETIIKPNDPVKIGDAQYEYTFAGWMLNDVLFDFNEPITSNITLVAKWDLTIKTYTVTYDSLGGSAVESETKEYGETFTKPTNPTKQADSQYIYTFASWTLDGVDYDFATTVTRNIVLVARWNMIPVSSELDSYAITFNSNGGTAVSVQYVLENSTAVEPTAPTKAADDQYEYRFYYWSLDGVEFDFATPITSDITLDAQWLSIPVGGGQVIDPNAPKMVAVTYNPAGGSLVASETVVIGATFDEPKDPVKEGNEQYSYKFAGWYLDGVKYDFNTPATDNIILVAKWNKVPTKYTVVFNTLGGTAIESITFDYGTVITMPDEPTKAADGKYIYTFIGWYVDGVEYDFSKPLTDNIVLTAKWSAAEIVIPDVPLTPNNGNVSCGGVIGVGAIIPSVIALAAAGIVVATKKKEK